MACTLAALDPTPLLLRCGWLLRRATSDCVGFRRTASSVQAEVRCVDRGDRTICQKRV